MLPFYYFYHKLIIICKISSHNIMVKPFRVEMIIYIDYNMEHFFIFINLYYVYYDYFNVLLQLNLQQIAKNSFKS